MKEILNCYANWRIQAIIITAIIALVLMAAETEAMSARIAGAALAALDIIICRRWRKAGKLQELDHIAE